MQVCKHGPNRFWLQLNDSYKEVLTHRLADGGLLLSVDGASLTTYIKEEIDRYRVMVNNRTYVFEKENDPSVMRSPSAGKLLNWLVDDGDHVAKGEAYAEIEVMKMVMTLTAGEAGIISWDRRPGAVLETGAVVACIQLDDASLVTKAQPYSGRFLGVTDQCNVHNEALHSRFKRYLWFFIQMKLICVIYIN